MKKYIAALFLVTLIAGCELFNSVKTFSVSYEANGAIGTCPVDATEYQAGNSFIVAGCGDLAFPGNVFSGWNTAADGSGTSMEVGSEQVIGEDNIVLYAYWVSQREAEYTVTYDGNGNDGGTVPDPVVYKYLDQCMVPDNPGNLTRSGYGFKGWNINKEYEGNSMVYFGVIEDTILYAQWEVQYGIIFDGNGADGGTVPDPFYTGTANYSYTFYLYDVDLTKAGYKLTGWNTAADGSGTLYKSLDQINLGTTVQTLYANWISVYPVTYDGNGNTAGIAPVDENNYESGDTVYIKSPDSSFVKEGYKFSGWNTKADGSGTAYSTYSSIIMGNGSVTFYAVWTPVYTIKYDGNGNTGGAVPVDNSTYETGDTVFLKAPDSTLVKDGYFFHSWNTKADGSGSTYFSSSSISMDSTSLTFYAQWYREYNDLGQVTSHTSDSGYCNPYIKIKKSPFFSVTNAGIKKSGSSYIDGTLEIKYVGNSPVYFVNCNINVLDANGTLIFKDNGYIDNNGYIDLGSGNYTDTYLTSEHNTGYVAFIEDLSPYNASISNIHTLEIEIGYTLVNGSVDEVYMPCEVGTPVAVSDTSVDSKLTNKKSFDIKAPFNWGFLKDSDGRIGNWTSGSLLEYNEYGWKYIDSILSPGQTGKVTFSVESGETILFHSYDPEPATSSGATRNRLPDLTGLTQNEINMEMIKYRKEKIIEQIRQSRPLFESR